MSCEKRADRHGGIHIADNFFIEAQLMPQNPPAGKPIRPWRRFPKRKDEAAKRFDKDILSIYLSVTFAMALTAK